MAPSHCIICNKGSANACAVCKSVGYCSRTCQAVDWQVHRTLCKKFSKLPLRPKIPSRLGFLFAADHHAPQLVWVPCRRGEREGYDGLCEDPDVDSFMGGSGSEVDKRFNIVKNEVRGYNLDYTVVLYGRDSTLDDGSKPNQTALALTDWNMPFDWRGDLLVMSCSGVLAETVKPESAVHDNLSIGIDTVGGEVVPFQDYLDVTMADLRTVVDYLSFYEKDIAPNIARTALDKTISLGADAGLSELIKEVKRSAVITESERDGNLVRGVLIRCEGDIGLNKRDTGRWERYSEMEVARNHPVWKNSPVGASKVMGLPILVYRLPANPAWDSADHTRFDNQPATFLNLTVDPKEEEMWGFAPAEWQFQVGSVLVVRQDGRDLSREQGWALAEYLQFRVSDAFEEAMESGEQNQRRTAVLKMLNWKRFDSWLKNFRIEMIAAEGDCWKDVKSPF